MKRKLTDLLICPACLPGEVPLELFEASGSESEVIEGDLRCAWCGCGYPVRNGVARLIPPGLEPAQAAARYEEPDLLSSYLWSHYADLMGDPDSLPACGEWAGLIAAGRGAALDAGCATGRFTFELAGKCGFAVGLDRSASFVSAAREIAREGRLVFEVREEGRIRSEREIFLPESWRARDVEFIVGDAQALPFRSGVFSAAASLNVVDRIPRPLNHLLELCRVAMESNAQLLVSDPFSWSEEVCAPDRWLGGNTGGEFAGPALENIAGLLSGAGRAGVSPPWKISRRGAVWWKIRNHRNHFELIRSLCIKAER